MSLFTRFFLGTLLVLGLGIASAIWLVSGEVKKPMRESRESTLVDTANLLAELVAPDLARGALRSSATAVQIQRYAERRFNATIFGVARERPEYRIYITDAQGRLLLDTAGESAGADYSQWRDVYLTLRGRYGARSSPRDPQRPEQTVMYVAAPIRYDGRLIGVVSVGAPNDSVEPFLLRAQQRFIELGLAVGAATLLLGLALAWWFGRGARRLAAYAEAVSRGERAALPAVGGGELGLLATALDDMRTRLEGKAYVENYVQLLTHELKSPIAAIRGSAELLQEELPPEARLRFAHNARQEAQRLQEIVERLLTLARVEARQEPGPLASVPVAALLAALVAAREPQWRARALQLTIDAPADLHVTAERFLLEQAIGNLLDNAIDFAPAGSTITLSALCVDGGIAIRIRDHGPGIPDYARPRLFERFFSLPRPGSERKSTGLGLVLVREVALLHQGRIELRPAEGGGTVAEFWLPSR